MVEVNGRALVYPGRTRGNYEVFKYTCKDGLGDLVIPASLYWQVFYDSQQYDRLGHSRRGHWLSNYTFQVFVDEGCHKVVGWKRSLDDEGTELISYLEMP